MATLHDIAAAYVELERRLNKVGTLDYPPERKIGRGRLTQQAEELAAELRSRLGLGLGPIPDLEGILELELGVRISYVRFRRRSRASTHTIPSWGPSSCSTRCIPAAADGGPLRTSWLTS